MGHTQSVPMPTPTPTRRRVGKTGRGVGAGPRMWGGGCRAPDGARNDTRGEGTHKGLPRCARNACPYGGRGTPL